MINKQKKIIQKLLRRPLNSHKYNFGHVLIIGGSEGMVGAPFLAGKAALRVGAGLVTIASTHKVIDKLEKRVEEIMTLTLPLDITDAAKILKKFIRKRNISTVIIGPGLKPSLASLTRRLMSDLSLPMIIDGGGLTALQGHLDLVSRLNTPRILTPHLGEFQKLTNNAVSENSTNIEKIAKQFAIQHSITLVLKGHPTYVAHKDGTVYINKTGNPGLATAGTGDVLTGVIAGLISQDIEPEQAAEAAAYLHGLAGDIAMAQKTQPGLIASDVIECIPLALKSIT